MLHIRYLAIQDQPAIAELPRTTKAIACHPWLAANDLGPDHDGFQVSGMPMQCCAVGRHALSPAVQCQAPNGAMKSNAFEFEILGLEAAHDR